jgi:hypothetical protein
VDPSVGAVEACPGLHRQWIHGRRRCWKSTPEYLHSVNLVDTRQDEARSEPQGCPDRATAGELGGQGYLVDVGEIEGSPGDGDLVDGGGA